MDYSKKYISHYEKWLNNKFDRMRIYYISLIVIAITPFIIFYTVSIITDQAFDYLLAIKIAVTFSIAAVVAITAIRYAEVSASWLIANEAMAQIIAKREERAWAILAAKYRGMHPIVINDNSFQEIMLAAIQATDDPSARNLVKYLSTTRRTHTATFTDARKSVALSAHRGSLYIIIIGIMFLITMILRFIFLVI